MSERVSTREGGVEMLAKVLCMLTGFWPIDEADGSPNYWLFHADAEKMIADLERRGFEVKWGPTKPTVASPASPGSPS